MRVGIGIIFVLAFIFFSLIALILSPYSMFTKIILMVSLVTTLNAYLVYHFMKAIEKLTGHVMKIIKYMVWSMVFFLYFLTLQFILVMIFPQMAQPTVSLQLQNFYLVMVIAGFALVIVYYSFILSISKEVKEFEKIYGFKVEKRHGKIRAKES